MSKALRPSELVPRGFAVESAVAEGSGTIITVRALAATSRCPTCGGSTRRVHSRYLRTVFDLPLSGRVVRLVVQARRFRCDVARCSQMIFTERFAGEILRPWSRRTVRVDDLAHHLGLALGGRPGACFARRLMLVIGNDTLLRLVRRRAQRPAVAPTVIGIDDWAWRRNRRYGTLVCDLERRQVVCLLPDHEAGTAEAWLVSLRSRSSRGIGAAATPWPRHERCPMRCRSPTAGISWRTPAGHSPRQCGSRCVRSAR